MTMYVPFDLNITEKWVMPTYVFEGQTVVVPYLHEGKRRAIPCVVVVAAGNHARVSNDELKLDRWFDLEDMRVEAPAGPRALRRLKDAET